MGTWARLRPGGASGAMAWANFRLRDSLRMLPTTTATSCAMPCLQKSVETQSRERASGSWVMWAGEIAAGETAQRDVDSGSGVWNLSPFAALLGSRGGAVCLV